MAIITVTTPDCCEFVRLKIDHVVVDLTTSQAKELSVNLSNWSLWVDQHIKNQSKLAKA